uniref:NADH-ubiquinone oxidoreductase chain 5 n=1 Tax=Eurydice pulchra TaxID=155694 RepID=E3SX79_EURPU|nr:NADH dehydrogenase subunit 5 [Eurydice pulchra]
MWLRSPLYLVGSGGLIGVSLSLGALGLKGVKCVWEYEIVSGMVFTLYWDNISLLFFSAVSLIAGSVIYFSGSYMGHDTGADRFTYLVLFFVFSMFFVVFSLNMVSILLGWDGLGLVSYILVVYYQNESSNAAGMITALSNRVGDAAILLCIGVMGEWGSWSFMMNMSESGKGIALLVVLAAITKSAQVPFSAWLPAAMAAPTPVSALVHSSTLVTAGVYLLIRFSPVLEDVRLGLLALALMTTFMTSVSATQETDLKKIVALSTLSQLGIMMGALASGFPLIAYFHLLTHALFKALLFMCSGKIIHESNETQDNRAMGGLSLSLPYTGVFMNVANMALCGAPFLAGFYSKDLLVEMELLSKSGGILVSLIGLSVGLSAVYSVRLTYLSIVGGGLHLPLHSSGDDDPKILKSKVLLGVGAVVGGSTLSWVLFSSSEAVVLPPSLKFLTVGAILVGVGAGVVLSTGGGLVNNTSGFPGGLIQMWFMPLLSGHLLTGSGLPLSKAGSVLESGWLEKAGGQGAYSSLFTSSGVLLGGQEGGVKLMLISFSLLVLVGVMLSYPGQSKLYFQLVS